MYKITFLISFFLLSLHVFSQTTITGKITDKNTNESIEAAIVKDLKTNKNTLTNKNGEFSLSNTMPSDTIKISFIGYKPKYVVSNDTAKPMSISIERGGVNLKEVVITSHSNNLTTTKTLSLIDLDKRPVKSAQDLLRLVPGLFIAQHQGGGKAEQIFLRGFDADHGSDVSVSVDGLPVNMVSHAHGQGYADLHFLIPETVAGYDFGKGAYYASKGDLCTAGYVAYNTINQLDKSMVKLEGGQFNTGRLMGMFNLLNDKAKERGQSAYIAGETLYSDGGPFQLPEHFKRDNLFGKFNTNLGANNRLTITLSTLYSKWQSAGELPNRALKEGYISSRFGVLDSAQGGYTTRTNANIKLVSTLNKNTIWENQAFYSHYYFNLITNFTFHYYYPTAGDEFGQHENRDMAGYKSTITHKKEWGNTILTSSFSVGGKYDHTHPSWLAHTYNGSIINLLQLGKVREANANMYFEETLERGKWLFNAGARLDYFNFNYQDLAPASDSDANIFSGQKTTQNKEIICPKLNVQYTFNPQLQLYVKAGKGFHSNDARVVIANEGFQILPPAYGLDLGINWKPAPRLFINTALWYLYLKQEFTFGQDLSAQGAQGQAVQPGGRTVRKGIDLSVRYQINDWLFGDLNADLADPKCIDSAKGHNYLALAPTFTSTAGLFFNFKSGWNGGLSYRYLHDRAANTDYSLTALGYFVTDASVNYTKKNYQIGLSIQNLFSTVWNESQFEYTSQLKNEKAPVDEVSYTPGAPFFAKAMVTVFF